VVAVVLRWRCNGVLLGIRHAAGAELAGTCVTLQPDHQHLYFATKVQTYATVAVASHTNILCFELQDFMHHVLRNCMVVLMMAQILSCMQWCCSTRTKLHPAGPAAAINEYSVPFTKPPLLQPSALYCRT
jgi:hypothetical protein